MSTTELVKLSAAETRRRVERAVTLAGLEDYIGKKFPAVSWSKPTLRSSNPPNRASRPS